MEGSRREGRYDRARGRATTYEGSILWSADESFPSEEVRFGDRPCAHAIESVSARKGRFREGLTVNPCSPAVNMPSGEPVPVPVRYIVGFDA